MISFFDTVTETRFAAGISKASDCAELNAACLLVAGLLPLPIPYEIVIGSVLSPARAIVPLKVSEKSEKPYAFEIDTAVFSVLLLVELPVVAPSVTVAYGVKVEVVSEVQIVDSSTRGSIQTIGC